MGKINPISEWANTGNKTAPSGSKINDGWLPNEQPDCEWENYLQNEKDRKINELVGALSFIQGEPPTKEITDVFAEYSNAKDFHHLYSDKNRYALDSYTRCSCRGYNYTLKQYTLFVAVHNDPNTIHEFYNDYETGEIGCIEHNINIDGGDTVNSLVCNGDYLFVGTTQSGVSSIYKFDINPWNGISVDSCTFTAGFTIYGNKGMILATADKLAVIHSNGLANNIIATVTISTMTVDGYGKGNASLTAAVEVSNSGLASDGTNLYFTIRQTASTKQVAFCAAKISTRGIPDAAGLATPILITATGYDGFPTALIPTGLIFDGSTIWLMIPGRNGYTSDHIGLFIYDVSGDVFYSAANPVFQTTVVDNLTQAAIGGDDDYCGQMTFDGKRIWIQGYEFGTGISFNRFISPFVPEASPKERPLLLPNRFHVGYVSEAIDTSHWICYSDDAIWFAQNLEHEIRRLPAISRCY
jgi:hypothetical protein